MMQMLINQDWRNSLCDVTFLAADISTCQTQMELITLPVYT